MSLSIGSANRYRLTSHYQQSFSSTPHSVLGVVSTPLLLCSDKISCVVPYTWVPVTAQLGHPLRATCISKLLLSRRVTASVAAVFCFGVTSARVQRLRGPFHVSPSGTPACGNSRRFATAAEDDGRRTVCYSSSGSSSQSAYVHYDAYWPLVPTVLGPILVPPLDSNDGSADDFIGLDQQRHQQPTARPPLPLAHAITASASVSDAPAAARSSSAASPMVPSTTVAAASGSEMDPFSMDLRDVVAACAAAASAGAGRGAALVTAAAAADGKAAPSVDVTRHNFEVMLPVVRRYLAACDFFAFDCEMTGLFLEGQQENYLDDMQDRYTRTAAAAQSFVITQFGLSCMRRLAEPGLGGEVRYAAATFNFALFPRPHEGAASRRFVCDAGSLSFLASQGFDFNRCIYDGVPFMPVRQRDELLRQLDRDNNGGGGGGVGGEGVTRADVTLTKPEDIAFVQGLLTAVHEWLSSGTEEPLDLPPVNRYLRLLTYQALARPDNFGGPPGGPTPSWHPGFYVKKVVDERNWTRVRLVRCASAAQAAEMEAADREERRGAVEAAAGFAAVWEAMRECGRPGVGHNCMFDVAYGVSQFGEGRLPATWEGFKRAIAVWFRGGLYDTKHICRQLPDVLGSDTTLAVMYGSLVPQPPGSNLEAKAAAAGAASIPPLPPLSSSPLPGGPLPARVSVSHCRGFVKYVALAAGQCAHEAGYDAFKTGGVFVALEAILAERGASGGGGAGVGAEGPVGDLTMQDLAPAAKEASLRLVPYASVAPYMWRLNVTRSDLPYALARPTTPADPTSREPVPERPLVFHLGSLSCGVRANDIHRAFDEAGLGKVRITFLPGNNALVELEAEAEAAQLRARLGGEEEVEQEGERAPRGLMGLCAEILPYAQYRARKDDMLAAGLWPLPGYGLRGVGNGVGGAGLPGPNARASSAAAAGAAGSRPPAVGAAAGSEAPDSPTAGIAARPAKRPRVEPKEEATQAPGRQCVMM